MPARQRSQLRPVFAGSCSQAAGLLANRAFECVLLDHNLPDGTGAGLLQGAAAPC